MINVTAAGAENEKVLVEKKTSIELTWSMLPPMILDTIYTEVT